ncbi:MAG TPA: DedA family protein [Thermoleophilia bacterium]|nr:DedA family protein [Thermoleophilia bacterium]
MQSIVNSLVTWCTHVIATFGLPGVFALMFVESACIPIPAEATMLFAGFAVSTGQMGFAAAVAAGVAGNVVGAWITYWVGLYGGRPFIDRYGKYVLLRHDHIELAERWFARYGSFAVAFCRVIPGVRSFVSLPAGIARMPFWKFTFWTAVGCLPFVTVLVWLGDSLGANWRSIERNLSWLNWVVAAVVAALVVWAVVGLLRQRGRAGERDQAGAD